VAILEPLRRTGAADAWRGLAGLLLASVKEGMGDLAAAHREYSSLAEAAWAADVRPQALAGAARTVPRTAGHGKILERKSSKLRFGVQVGAYAKKSYALQEKARLEKAGKTVRIVQRRHAAQILHHVIVGSYGTHEEAGRAAEDLKAQGLATVAIVASF
jgi:cell division protein FtsN